MSKFVVAGVTGHVGSVVARVQGAIDPVVPPFIDLFPTMQHKPYNSPTAGHLGRAAASVKLDGQHLAAAIYSWAFLVMALFFTALNRPLLLVKPHRLREQLPIQRRRQILARSVSGVIPYAIATALAVVSSYLTLAICGALAVFYALPISSGGGGGASTTG